jgi:hypothetical protein
MEFDEKALRDMLASSYGQSCGQSVLEAIENGHAIVIAMEDGSTTTLSSKTQALRVMVELFGWTPDP